MNKLIIWNGHRIRGPFLVQPLYLLGTPFFSCSHSTKSAGLHKHHCLYHYHDCGNEVQTVTHNMATFPVGPSVLHVLMTQEDGLRRNGETYIFYWAHNACVSLQELNTYPFDPLKT